MPPVNCVGDQNTLVPVTNYPYAKFPFEFFNPVQSRVFEFYEEECNMVIAAATSAGKTIMSELFMAQEVRKRGGKAMYLAPMRALAQEKIDDWTDPTHHFADLNLEICTGDYRLTPERRSDLEKANVILMTTEMLNSRCRNFTSEQNEWMKDIGTLVIDESHLLSVAGRGDHLEAGLMKFTQINPNARLVLLSATMPNVKEISEWVSYDLTKRTTHLIESAYRPCPLNIHYEKYVAAAKYEDNELQKIDIAKQIVQYYTEDKFLVFAHTKRTGDLMKAQLQQAGIDCEFHNADLDKDKRIKLEKKFKEDPKFRVIIATSTLAWGCNLPARRVIILGVHRGLTIVDNFDIWQEVGRAGRPKYDPVGDAYILLPSVDFDDLKDMLKTPQEIKSQLLTEVGGHYKTLAFHLVSEIHHGHVKTIEDIHKWFERSLAHHQSKALSDEIVDSTTQLLVKCGAIKEIEGGFEVTAVGKIASMFYYSPFDTSDLKKNFYHLFEKGNENDDFYLSMALGNVDTQRGGICSKSEKEEMAAYANAVIKRLGRGIPDPVIKAGHAYYQLLNDMNTGGAAGFKRGLQFDFPRLNQVIQAIDTMSGGWHKKEFFKLLELRVAYGVKPEMAHLCKVTNIGKARAEKLWKAGLRSFQQIANNPALVTSVLKMKPDKIQEIVNSAALMGLK